MTKASPQADQDLIRAIAELLNEQNLAEIEIERRQTRSKGARPRPTAPSIAGLRLFIGVAAAVSSRSA